MSTSRQLCKFIDRGCRFGDNCRFSHDRTLRVTSPTPPGSPAGRGGRGGSLGGRGGSPGGRGGSPAGRQRPPHAGPMPDHAPRGNCDFFWSSGQCNRGFECTFQHVQNPHGAVSPETPADAAENGHDTLDFSTIEGLADMNSISQNSLHKLGPAEAHNAMKSFSGDHFRFSRPEAMIEFVRVIASVDRRSTLWNSDQAQAFLEMVVKGNSLTRIREVLQFQSVSHRVGMGFVFLSFQRGYLPVLQFFTSDLILKTTLHHNINALYTALEASLANVFDIVTKCMQPMVDARSWKDPTPALPPSRQVELSGIVIFKTLSTLLMQFFFRFKQAIHNHPEIVPFVNQLLQWFETWAQLVSCSPPAFVDPIDPNLRKLTVNEVRDSITKLQEIVEREHSAAEAKKKPLKASALSNDYKAQALLTRLRQSYDPPGDLREGGLPRHDNDAADISDIRIVPTTQELMSATTPYLPINLPEAPHHCPPNTMQRHVDIQFRLLREELIAPVRESISTLQLDFDTMRKRGRSTRIPEPTQLEQLIAKNGSLYKTTGFNSVMFNVYTNVEFSPLKAERRTFTVGLILDAPAGHARDPDPKVRQEFWKTAGSKRLTSGSLVVLVLVAWDTITVHLGSVSSSNSEIIDSSKAYDNQIEIRIRFFDAEIELRALRRDKISVGQSTFALLIDNNIMFESIRPFLETLRSVEPISIPFSRYISRGDGLGDVALFPPKYATSPSFRYNLDCLANTGEYIHPLNATDPASIRRARQQLKASSRLDPSQCEAMVDVLTREVGLIQGPPGTGKSFTGKEILRVLFSNKVKPVVLIAFTNHALDHMLLSVLEANITKNLVRLGSRSSDERIEQYTLDKLEKLAGKSPLDRSMGREYAAMKRLEEAMKRVLDNIQVPHLTWEMIREYLEVTFPELLMSFTLPPYWIDQLADRMRNNSEDGADGEWVSVGKKKHGDHVLENSIYSFWKDGLDLAFINPPTLPLNEEGQPQIQSSRGRRSKKKHPPAPVFDHRKAVEEHKLRMDAFFEPLGFGGLVPQVPTGRRGIHVLLESDNIWSMSSEERRTLANSLEDDIRSKAYNSHLHQFDALREEYEVACRTYSDVKDESRRRLLSQVDLIGCTTNGAAKLISLLTTVAPKVLMVEEAGQVLEAHILASLVPSVQHLICIGDPQQLRPNLANYNLSMDSERGQELYKFDRSLMERLADSALPMSQIHVQRRMRPSISHYISMRTILYPNLEDHERVSHYPSVRGMQKDVFFYSHTNKENGGDQASVSKSNTFEASYTDGGYSFDDRIFCKKCCTRGLRNNRDHIGAGNTTSARTGVLCDVSVS